MYQPPHFREDDPAVQRALIRAHPLGLLVTHGAAGLEANHIPFVLDDGLGPHGTLQGHLARPNSQWREAVASADALVVFQGADAYITPSWYSTKSATGKVVPTWNYAVVQVHGRLRVIDDREWLRRQIEALTRSQESQRQQEWHVADAPPEYIETQLNGIIGIELEIARVDGKWKASQNRPAEDRAGVAAGLRADGEPGEAMASLVEAASRQAAR